MLSKTLFHRGNVTCSVRNYQNAKRFISKEGLALPHVQVTPHYAEVGLDVNLNVPVPYVHTCLSGFSSFNSGKHLSENSSRMANKLETTDVCQNYPIWATDVMRAMNS